MSTVPLGSFDEFFQRATGHAPYPYQRKLACVDDFPELLDVPTGLGKTLAIVLAWLWRRRFASPATRAKTPRRLVYCLPMRVLVEQTRDVVEGCLKAICDLAAGKKSEDGSIEVHVLMGGEDRTDWAIWPERDAVLIGTQDMLLSRALNRGYAASRFHWPIDFGLLHNDCLWVFDEPQLMASGVSTSAQLAGLRQSLTTFGSCPSVWMSATLEPGWLDTIDFKGRVRDTPLKLTDDDYDPKGPAYRRMTADKALHPLGVSSSKDMKDVAKAVMEKHVSGTQTLAVLNTVDRAKAMFSAIQSLRKKSPTPRLLLVHSRFRPAEREQLNQQIQDKGEAAKDRIIVATQVVEAGVDISARTLVTELAPWASIVQRIGRCNRTGADGPGQVFWIDLEEKLSPPYTAPALDFAREQLKKLEGKSVSPKDLDDFKTQQKITLPFEHKHVLRRRDLLDLFDTAPDLSGNDIDIQRFVRSDDPDIDLQVFWRDIPAEGPNQHECAPQRQELCSVPVGQFRTFLDSSPAKKRPAAYVWDHLDDQWLKVDPKGLRPGLTVLLSATAGGYSTLGWDPSSTEPVASGFRADDTEKASQEAIGSDPSSASPIALAITEHTEHVCSELCELLKPIAALPDAWPSLLIRAARWHDVGKGHAEFQIAMRKANPLLDTNQLWAKSGTNARLRHGRRYLRHELASALAALQQNMPFLVAYLAAAHHGRVRLAIRAMPGEDEPTDPNIPFALGVHHGDLLPEVDLGQHETCPATVIDLSPMHLGGERSWTAAALRLLAEFGPFRLAYLEALLRAADARASRREANHA